MMTVSRQDLNMKPTQCSAWQIMVTNIYSKWSRCMNTVAAYPEYSDHNQPPLSWAGEKRPSDFPPEISETEASEDGTWRRTAITWSRLYYRLQRFVEGEDCHDHSKSVSNKSCRFFSGRTVFSPQWDTDLKHLWDETTATSTASLTTLNHMTPLNEDCVSDIPTYEGYDRSNRF